MSDNSTPSQPAEKIQIEFNSHKINIDKKLENDSINFYLSSTYFKDFKGSLTLDDIVSKIPAFEDYNIQESFDIINEIKPDQYSLTEESGKFCLVIKLIVLKKEKKLQINLEELQKSKEKIIDDLETIKRENNTKINELKEKYKKLLEECEELSNKKKELEKKTKTKLTNNNEKDKNSNRCETNLSGVFKIKEKRIKANLQAPKNLVKTLTVLADGRLVVGAKGEIIVYSSKTNEIDLQIKEENIDLDTLIGISTGKLLSLENQQNIKIYDIKEKTYEIIQTLQFENKITCVKEFDDKSLCATYNTTIAVYSLNEDNTYSEKYKITANLIKYYGFVQINQNQLCVSTELEGKEFLSFYELSLKEPYAVTKGVPITSLGYKLDDKYLYFVKGNCIYLINIVSHELEAKYNLPKKPDGNPNDILGLCTLSSNMILISNSDFRLIQLKIEEKRISEYSTKTLGFSIDKICFLGNGGIATYHGGDDENDRIVQIW